MDPAAKAKLDALESRQGELASHLITLQQQHQLLEQSIDQFKRDSVHSEEVQKMTANVEAPTQPPSEEIYQEVMHTTPPPVPVAAQPSQISAPVEPPQAFEPAPPEVHTPLESPAELPTFNPNWEINFGQTWLVRIGVLSLLTGLIFLSTYAYKNWIYEAPAALKVGFFMLLSLGLTGAGFYFERAKENLKLYGRAITAGGLAAGYYTIYAAHFVESLHCISSPVMAGALLTAWAAIMLAYSCWKQSRIISIMATGLAFYGTIVNPAGWLSLFSALLLSASGMFLLVRYKWNNVGIITICAAYVAHAFWLGYYPQQLDPVVRICYLASYWAIFACATSRFAGATIELATARLITAINNSSSWVLAAFILPSFTDRPELGTISLIVGGFFLLCGGLARRQLIWKKELSNIYLYQGLFLITIGILVEASGYHRFLILALEAIMLMLAGHRLQHKWLKGISLIVYAFALGSTFFSNDPPMLSFIALSVISALYAGLTRWSLNDGESNEGVVALFPAFSTWIILYFGVFDGFETTQSLSYTIAIAALVWGLFLALKKKLYLQDLALIASIIPLVCGGILSFNHFESANSLGVALPIIGLGMWWSSKQIFLLQQRNFDQAPLTPWNDISDFLAWAYSCFVSFTIYQLVSLSPTSDLMWLYFGGALAILAHFIAVITKRISIAIPAQVFHILAILSINNHSPSASLLPFMFLGLHLFLSEYLWGAKPILRRFLAPLAAIALCRATDHPEIFLTVLALAFYGLAFFRKDNLLTITGALATLFIASFDGIIEPYHSFELLDYLPMAALLAICAIPNWSDEKLTKPWSFAKGGFKFGTLILLFAYASAHTLDHYVGNGLAICWALLAAAIFSLGLFTQHRSYRLTGLIALAASIIHVVTIDVMALNTLGRILSFITIGLILMGLGYLYNRFQERISKFL